MKQIYVGVTGYSNPQFDIAKATQLIQEAYDEIEKTYGTNINIVSGLTNEGIPAIAYQEAIKREWQTTGVACKLESKYEEFPVTKKIIIGESWGDESATFLEMIDVLIRIGGGSQALQETKNCKEMNKPVLEYDLKAKEQKE